MLINISYYISLILLGQKCLYMIIILYQTIVILNTYILKYIYSIVSFNQPILVYMYTHFVILFKINTYHEVIYLNKMITIIQVKAHFMKFNCFSLHSLTSVIFLHTILQSLRFTVLLCMSGLGPSTVDQVLKYTKYPKYIPSTSTGQVLIFLKKYFHIKYKYKYSY